MNRGYKQNKISKFFEKYPRHYYVFAFFVIFFLTIIAEVFSYTVINHEFYKGLADKQQIGKIKIPVTRGTIYSMNNSGTVLATSVNLNDLAIDPQVEGDKTRLTIFLMDIVYKEICYLKTEKYCKKMLSRFLGVLELEDFKKDEKYIKDKIITKLANKLSKTKVDSVLIETELDENKINKIKSYKLGGIFIIGNNLYANPELISDPKHIATIISPIIGWEIKEFKHYIRKRDLRYIPILNRISIGVGEEVKNTIKEEKEAISNGIISSETSISNFIILTPNPHRLYPEREVGSQILGFVDSGLIGRYGIEGYFENLLKGNPGKILNRKDTNGRIINLNTDESEDSLSKNGVNIYTTIDRNIQAKAETIIEQGVKKFKANKGSIVIMNPKTGEIKAMANYPTYDSNNPGEVYDIEKVTYYKYPNPKTDLRGIPLLIEDSIAGDKMYYDSKEIFLREANNDERNNYAITKYKYKNNFGAQVYQNSTISSLYEPGSIMKAMTMAIGIDSGEITANTMYMDKGIVKIEGNKPITNVSDKCKGYHSFAHALNYSCNVGMIHIVQKYGKAIAYEYLNNFGFSEKTGISLKGEVNAEIVPFEKWSRAKLFTTSYGLGISVNQLQMATAYSVLANGGLYIKPRIIDRIDFYNGNSIKYKKEIERRVIKESTAKTMVRLLVDSVNNGVAGNGKVEGFSLAGKTGTAQIATRGIYESGNEAGTTYGSFAGFGPAEDPQFVIIVKLERPRTNNYGGATSSYIFKDMATYLLNYYGIPKRSNSNLIEK